MFAAPRISSHRQRSASHSADDQSIHQNPRKLFQRYAHDLTMSSQSLATVNSQLDDVHIPSPPTLASHSHHPTSTPSTPTTSPSTGYSSLFPGSLSSATSESIPSTDPYYRSEFGVLTPASHSPISSRSSNPPCQWSQSSNGPDTHPSAPHEHSSSHLSQRPSTAPHFSPSPVSPAAAAGSGITADISQHQSQAERHSRSHSRLTVTIKNLLSKPVVPSPSRFSFRSTTSTTMRSETDTLFSPSAVPGASSRWPTTTTPCKSRHSPDLEITDAHYRCTNETGSKSYEARTGCGSSTSPESIAVSSTSNAHTPSPAAARGKEPRQRNVLRRRPSGSAKLIKGRERGMSSPPHNLDLNHIRLLPKWSTSHHQARPSSPLTPASAVAEAYKQQQEFRRDDSAPPTKLSMDNQGSLTASHDGVYDRKSRFETVERGRVWTTGTGAPQPAPSISDSVGRSLTRKVSARWRKLKGGEADVMRRTSEDSPSRDRARGHSKARPSLQEMWKGGRVRSTGQSMDGVPNPNAGDGACVSPAAGRQHADSGSGCEEVADGSGEGSKLWRLMRRISTGGLRDRLQVQKEKVVPPVPAIPKELLEKVNQGQGERGGSEQPLSTLRHPPVPRNNVSNSNSIITPARPSVATSSSVRSSDVSSSPFFSKTHSARSSVSSYGEALGGSSVLDRHIIAPLEQLRLGDGQCGELSTSTSTVAVPVVLQSPHRSPSVPACLRRAEDAEDGGAREPSPLSSSPARRQTCSGESPSSKRGSWRASLSPASASGSPNAHHTFYHHQTHGLSSLSPPPPRRSSSRSLGRGGGAGGSVTSLPSSSSPSTRSSHSHLHSRSVVVGKQADGSVRQMERMPSAQSNMTERGGDSTTEPGRLRLRVPERGREQDGARSSPHTTTGTQFTFRELPPGDLARRPPLSEQEKADIWDDLLARSDQAGGTLHIYGGAPELMSDSLRFSMCSEA